MFPLQLYIKATINFFVSAPLKLGQGGRIKAWGRLCLGWVLGGWTSQRQVIMWPVLANQRSQHSLDGKGTHKQTLFTRSELVDSNKHSFVCVYLGGWIYRTTLLVIKAFKVLLWLNKQKEEYKSRFIRIHKDTDHFWFSSFCHWTEVEVEEGFPLHIQSCHIKRSISTFAQWCPV